jgi:hypothetical protein
MQTKDVSFSDAYTTATFSGYLVDPVFALDPDTLEVRDADYWRRHDALFADIVGAQEQELVQA